MLVAQLKKEMNKAFDEHADALATGVEENIWSAWYRYAKAKNAYLEAYHSGED